MAAPTSASVAAATWTKVATAVTHGQIGFDKSNQGGCYVCWVLTGASAPTTLATAHPVPEPVEGVQPVLPISADAAIDVYVYSPSAAISVIVEV